MFKTTDSDAEHDIVHDYMIKSEIPKPPGSDTVLGAIHFLPFLKEKPMI